MEIMEEEEERKETKFERSKPYILCVFNSLIGAASNIVSKFSLDEGMSRYVLIVYASALGTLVTALLVLLFERKNESKISGAICLNIFILGVLRTLGRVTWFAGLEYTSATFSASITNLIPSMTFILAVIFRMEKLEIGKLSSRAKIGGTIIAFGGATLMTLYKGKSVISFHKALHHSHHQNGKNFVPEKNFIVGSLLIALQCLSAAVSVILQARLIKKYPAPMRLTTLIGVFGTLTSAILAAIIDHKASSWRLPLDFTLIAPLYNGIVIFGIAGYLQTLVVRKKGPVFSTSFRPLSTLLVAILGLLLLGEALRLGEILGAALIITGLYAILWGKEAEKKKN
ncbi:WAT1-related protein At5g07050-like isoform X1 [Euphorbia lathyris]|uniref:WAT1-related protein At5g07050-like isoform X1 n=1 Tax=Euphorbia lathyris TaxID=212925 RepID=UPI003313F412